MNWFSKIFLSTTFFFITINAFPTHDIWYLTFHAREYIQGDWIQNDTLDHFERKYLLPVERLDAMETIQLQVYEEMLRHLAFDKPALYENVSLTESMHDSSHYFDTVDVQTGIMSERDFKTIKNELIATFTSYGNTRFVRFSSSKYPGTFSKNDIDWPVFRLQFPQNITRKENEVLTTVSDTPAGIAVQPVPKEVKDQKNRHRNDSQEFLHLPLWISLGLNIFLITFLIVQRKRKNRDAPPTNRE